MRNDTRGRLVSVSQDQNPPADAEGSSTGRPVATARFVLQRILKALVTMAAVLIFVFVGARLTGDPISMMFPEGLTEQHHQRLLERYGLDEPIPVQFRLYLENMLQGDFGLSIRSNRPVTTIFSAAAKETLKLGGWALLLSIVAGLTIGVIASLKPRSRLAKGLMFISVVGYSVPGFVVAILLILVFSFHLNLLPSMGMGSAASYVMPVVAIAARPTATLSRFVRASFLEVLDLEYIRTARAKGLGERLVLMRHVSRNALIPVLTIASLLLIDILSGTLFVEAVFSWPGMGSLLINSVLRQDFPVIQFGVLSISVLVISVNLVIDLLYGVIDPRVREQRA